MVFGRNNQEKVLDTLKKQLGIDLYESGRYNRDKEMAYRVSISEKKQCIAVLNRFQEGKFLGKEWHIYEKSEGWIKKGTLNRVQCLKLYRDTKPYYIQSLLEDYNGQLTDEQQERMCLIICQEYLSSYCTSLYLNFKVRVDEDKMYWDDGKTRTEALYMPHRSPPPQPRTAEDLAKLDKLIDDMANHMTKNPSTDIKQC
ncbi:MAG: hypothetical protein R3Y63_12575 [Eubacteriales bacterium]